MFSLDGMTVEDEMGNQLNYRGEPRHPGLSRSMPIYRQPGHPPLLAMLVTPLCQKKNITLCLIVMTRPFLLVPVKQWCPPDDGNDVPLLSFLWTPSVSSLKVYTTHLVRSGQDLG